MENEHDIGRRSVQCGWWCSTVTFKDPLMSILGDESYNKA